MLINKLAAGLCVCLVLVACDQNNSSNTDSPKKIDEKEIAAKVNGAVITKSEVESYKTLQNNPSAPDAKLLDELIATELLRQEAEKLGLMEQPDIRFQVRLQTMETGARALLRSKFGGLQISEEDILREYEERIGEVDSREYKARHILVATLDEAKAILEALRNGGDFIELAEQRSTGPSGKDGGDLGWFQSQSMVPEFAAAIQAMQPGDISSQPVQTQFGFHIIKLEDTREIEKPNLETLRPQIQQGLISQKITEYVESIKDSATIERMQ